MRIIYFPKLDKEAPRGHEDCSTYSDMKTNFKKHVFSFWSGAFMLALVAMSGAYVKSTFFGVGDRNLSGNEKEYEITINSIKLDAMTKVSSKKGAFLRLRFDENSALEIGRGQGWALNAGQQIVVDQKIPLDSRFINSDETKFTLEVAFEQDVWGITKADVTLLRCNTIAKELSSFNRSYQCFIPSEKTAVLTYRLAERGVPPPSAETDSKVAGF